MLAAVAYREKVFKFDEFAAAAESARLYGRQFSDLVGPRHRLAGLDVFRSRHDLQNHGRSTHLLVGVERRMLHATHTQRRRHRRHRLRQPTRCAL